MLSYAGVDAQEGPFSGGVREDQFASFLRETQAKAIVEQGGIGLAEKLFQSLVSTIMQPTKTAQPPVATQLLDQVYAALLRSDYGALEGLAAALETARQGQAIRPTEAEIQMIRQKAERNAAVLLATQRGIKAARRRLADIRASSSSFVTYDRRGRRAEVVEPRSLAQRF